jgi:hypothetical protein
MLRETAAPAAAMLRRKPEDPSGAVQGAAGEALARTGHADEVLPVLERWLKNADQPWYGLQAANVLDRLGEAARPSLPTLREVFQRVAHEAGQSNPLQYQGRILEHIIAVLDGKKSPLVYPTVQRRDGLSQPLN